MMWRYRLYFFSKYAKYIGVISLVITFFNDAMIFKWLCSFGLLVLVEMSLDFATHRCSLLQFIGIIKIEYKYGKNLPSIDNYDSDIKYDLPFEGEWTVINGCFTKAFSHSWDIPTQRYAYDFVILDESGKSYTDDQRQVQDYYCYDQPILSPADGLVVEVVNNAEDSIIFGNGKFFNRARHIAGNYLVIRHDENEYSTLAHLKRDSIVVKAGERVTRGQRLATCGNSGNSTEPHLHFQLQNGQSFYSSAGLPIRFSNIYLSNPTNYENIDSRPRMDKTDIPDGMITRGYNVSIK